MLKQLKTGDRLSFIGGSDARIIMGDDEASLVRLCSSTICGSQMPGPPPCRSSRGEGSGSR
jgi:hypothetical protein